MSSSSQSTQLRIRLAAVAWLALTACGGAQPAEIPARVFDVRPGEEIQAALERAADLADTGAPRIVRVHAGTYRPRRPAQALVWFNARHDGIVLEAQGRVVLTAENADLSDPAAESHPAIVNHVVYFGDGVSSETVLRGFEITGANHFVTRSEDPGPIQPFLPASELQKQLFFYADGGAIKIFGRSYPTLEDLLVHDNYASPCAGGISIEHRGFKEGTVTLRDCVLRANRAQITGSALDVLPGSSALVENCLFVANVSNLGEDTISAPGRPHYPVNGSGAMTVFEGSSVTVRRCTFTGNWNGVDDRGQENIYEDSIFWQNTLAGGISPGPRYELDIVDGSGVRGCWIAGERADLRGSIDASANMLHAPDPAFDEHFVPLTEAYAKVGFRPTPKPAPR